ncbi:MAG: hypothetical protein DMF51_00240 [Acidobacteria bacterium]|nr:MAG: hypothetical protein DMF51_00240 [Acidobacteriota bacterium]
MATTKSKEATPAPKAKEPAAGTARTAAVPHRPAAEPSERGTVSSEEAQAQRIAARLGIPYVDLADFPIDHDLFRQIPVDLMFRYNFVPWREEEGRLVVVISDPSDVLMVDELEILLARPLRICVGGKTAINDVLKKSESSQRVLEAATEEFKIQVRPIRRSSSWSTRPCSTRCSAAPRTSTSRRASAR